MWPFTKRKPKAKPLVLRESSRKTQDRHAYYGSRLRNTCGAYTTPDRYSSLQASDYTPGYADAVNYDPFASASDTGFTGGGGDFGGGGSSGSWDSSPSCDSGSSYDSGSSSCDSGSSGGGSE